MLTFIENSLSFAHSTYPHGPEPENGFFLCQKAGHYGVSSQFINKTSDFSTKLSTFAEKGASENGETGMPEILMAGVDYLPPAEEERRRTIEKNPLKIIKAITGRFP